MLTLAQLNHAADAEFVAALGGIYEHSEWVAEKVLPQRPFAGVAALQQAMRGAVEDATDAMKMDLIVAHPDLAGKLARAGNLTESSTKEQAGLGLDRLSDEEYDHFTEANTRYREKFGFPFIICARRATKDGVLKAFAERLENSRQAEIREALDQIHQIGELRLGDLL